MQKLQQGGCGEWRHANELLENAVIQLRGIIRTTICYSQTRLNRFHLAWWSTQETSHPDVRKRDGRTPSESLHGKRPHQEFVPFGAKVLAGRWLGLRNNRAQSFIGALKGVSRAREARRSQQKERSDQQRDWDAMETHKWMMDSGQTRSQSGPSAASTVAI